MPVNPSDSAVPPRDSESNSMLGQAREAASKLVDECYKHPAVALAAVSAVALAAGGGVRALRNMSKEVLLVEDTPFMGQAFKASLEAQGQKVTWLTRVDKAFPLTGIGADGEKLVVDPRRIKYAFVDGDLGSKSFLQGVHVVDMLSKSGVPSFGTSTLPDLNRDMISSGARLAVDKPTILAGLVDKRFSISEAIRNPQMVGMRLDALRADMKAGRLEDLHERTSELLKKFVPKDL